MVAVGMALLGATGSATGWALQAGRNGAPTATAAGAALPSASARSHPTALASSSLKDVAGRASSARGVTAAPGASGADALSAASSQTTPLLTVRLAASCVAPGRTQTVVVRSHPSLQVAVNPRYADGKMGDVYGGEDVAQTIGPDGAFRETWKLAEGTPAGSVIVYAGVSATSGARVQGTASATFTVAQRC